jgi:hypothetical protein
VERSAPVTSEVLWVQIPVRPLPHVIERETLFDSVGYLQGLRVPPTLHYKLPNVVQRANFQVDARLSIQYFKT